MERYQKIKAVVVKIDRNVIVAPIWDIDILSIDGTGEIEETDYEDKGVDVSAEDEIEVYYDLYKKKVVYARVIEGHGKGAFNIGDEVVYSCRKAGTMKISKIKDIVPSGFKKWTNALTREKEINNILKGLIITKDEKLGDESLLKKTNLTIITTFETNYILEDGENIPEYCIYKLER